MMRRKGSETAGSAVPQSNKGQDNEPDMLPTIREQGSNVRIGLFTDTYNPERNGFCFVSFV